MQDSAPTDALAFPGQGVDPVDAVRVLDEHRDDPLVAALWELLGTASPEPADLLDTRIAQPCIVAAGLLVAAAHPAGAAARAGIGHSLGELTALAWAGALDPVGALRLARARAELGHLQQERRPGRMVALMKLDEAAVEQVRAGAVEAAGGSLELAVVNGERQLVLSGDIEPAEAAVDLAFEAGGVARRLGIGGAYHTTLLAHAVARFRKDALAAVAGDPVVPIVCSTNGIVRHGAEVADVLSQALVRPVRWPEALQRARDDLGVARGLDAGPGLTLATIAKHTPILPFVGLRPEPTRGAR